MTARAGPIPGPERHWENPIHMPEPSPSRPAAGAPARPVRTRRPPLITVGPQPAADLCGRDNRAIQAAMDSVARLGGGVVQILPGEFTLYNALFPPAGIVLRGSGPETVLRKAPGAATPITRDIDWYEYAVPVADASSFHVGGGVALSTDNNRFPQTRLFTITAIEGTVLYLNTRTEANYWVAENAKAASIHSLIHGWETDDVVVENLVLDGAAAENPPLNGNYGAGVFLQYCNRWRFRNLTCRNFNGDGFSFQVCDDIHFHHCQALNNANLGFHPGSGSQRPRFLDCESLGNDVGLFWCWGVCDGRAERCRLARNRSHGSSIGHRDTDNRLIECSIEENGETGVLFRPEPRPEWTPDRNRIEDCRIRNNGRVGIDIHSAADQITIRNCRFESDGKTQPLAIRIGAEAGAVRLDGNEFSGTAESLQDLRPPERRRRPPVSPE